LNRAELPPRQLGAVLSPQQKPAIVNCYLRDPGTYGASKLAQHCYVNV